MAQIRMTHTSEIKTTGSDRLTAKGVAQWAGALPEEAEITEVQESRGDFRETWKVFVGLKATWHTTVETK